MIFFLFISFKEYTFRFGELVIELFNNKGVRMKRF